jgi:hypothetical protein
VVALALLIIVTALQLAHIRLPFLTTTPGTVAAGLTAGVASGAAGIGGTVVALYVLARQAAPARIAGMIAAPGSRRRISRCRPIT